MKAFYSNRSMKPSYNIKWFCKLEYSFYFNGVCVYWYATGSCRRNSDNGNHVNSCRTAITVTMITIVRPAVTMIIVIIGTVVGTAITVTMVTIVKTSHNHDSSNHRNSGTCCRNSHDNSNHSNSHRNIHNSNCLHLFFSYNINDELCVQER